MDRTSIYKEEANLCSVMTNYTYFGPEKDTFISLLANAAKVPAEI